jgi:biopolymer transport protein ExbB
MAQHCVCSKLLLAVMAAPLAVMAGSLDDVSLGASNDLKTALADLSALRQKVEAERLPLARQVSDLEQKLTDERASLARDQRAGENQLVDLNALKSEAKRRSEEVKYVDSLLIEYTRAFHSRLNFVEEPRYQALFDGIEKASASADLTAAEKFSQRSALLEKSLDRAQEALGGELIEGRALDKQGKLQAGKVALVGPVAMFAGPAVESSGVLQLELNKADPTVVLLDGSQGQAARDLALTGKGEMALDATLGNAFKLGALKDSLIDRLAKGGLIMIPLLGLGVASLLVALFKWIQLGGIRSASEGDLQAVLQCIDREENDKALTHARGVKGPPGEILIAAVEHLNEKKEHLEEILYEKMLGARAKLERGIAFLALAATMGPLMGLLGTVMGMIATFRTISTFGSGDPKMLAAGISEALICTATGMAVAIPSLLFHAVLSRKAKSIMGGMERTAVGFVNGCYDEEEERLCEK